LRSEHGSFVNVVYAPSCADTAAPLNSGALNHFLSVRDPQGRRYFASKVRKSSGQINALYNGVDEKTKNVPAQIKAKTCNYGRLALASRARRGNRLPERSSFLPY